jgi:putative protease
VPIDRYDGTTNGVCLPPVMFDSERAEIEKLLQSAKERGAEHVLLGNLGQFFMARKYGLIVHGDFRLNLTNQESAALWNELGLQDWILSPELTMPQSRDIQGGSRVIVYGRIPLMVTEKCIGKEIGNCEECKSGELKLTDRRRVDFPVLKEWKHRSLIVNSVPIWMADRQTDLTKFGLTLQHFIFTTESRRQVADTIRAYRKGMPPVGDIRRLR